MLIILIQTMLLFLFNLGFVFFFGVPKGMWDPSSTVKWIHTLGRENSKSQPPTAKEVLRQC